MKTASKKTPKKRTAVAKSPKTPAKLGRKDGCEVEIRLKERSGKTTEAAERVIAFHAPTPPNKKPGDKRTPSNRPPTHLPEPTTEAFAAMGHPQRARMLLALLQGPATYRTIQKVTKLKAGPLYHHINQLRLAGLIAPRQRDLYELTRGGRNLALVAIAASPLLKDHRRRPVAQ